MNGAPPTAAGSSAPQGSGAVRGTLAWRVRGATHADVPQVAAAVHELLHELGATPPPALALQDATHTLLEHPDAGAVWVAQANGAIVGVLGCSWPTAIHAAGAYALIQDLWVDPAWRGRGVGGGLLGALYAHARERAMTRIEVGLPMERYAGLSETEAFYLAHDFAPVGMRMRRAVS